jgi:hypothetical protein
MEVTALPLSAYELTFIARTAVGDGLVPGFPAMGGRCG